MSVIEELFAFSVMLVDTVSSSEEEESMTLELLVFRSEEVLLVLNSDPVELSLLLSVTTVSINAVI